MLTMSSSITGGGQSALSTSHAQVAEIKQLTDRIAAAADHILLHRTHHRRHLVEGGECIEDAYFMTLLRVAALSATATAAAMERLQHALSEASSLRSGYPSSAFSPRYEPEHGASTRRAIEPPSERATFLQRTTQVVGRQDSPTGEPNGEEEESDNDDSAGHERDFDFDCRQWVQGTYTHTDSSQSETADDLSEVDDTVAYKRQPSPRVNIEDESERPVFSAPAIPPPLQSPHTPPRRHLCVNGTRSFSAACGDTPEPCPAVPFFLKRHASARDDDEVHTHHRLCFLPVQDDDNRGRVNTGDSTPLSPVRGLCPSTIYHPRSSTIQDLVDDESKPGTVGGVKRKRVESRDVNDGLRRGNSGCETLSSPSKLRELTHA